MANEPTMSKNLELFLFKTQATFGSQYGTLAAGDYADINREGSFSNQYTVHEVDSLSGSFAQPEAVPGDAMAEISLPYRLRTKGAGDPGYWRFPMLCCGFTESDSSDVFTYAPTSTRTSYVDGECWHYTGDKSTSGALLSKAYNLLGSFEIDLPSGGVPTITFTMKGATIGPPSTATQPSVTRNTTATKAVLGATVSIHGVVYKLVSAKVSGNIEHDVTLDMSATYGHGRSLFSDRKIKWSATIYKVTTGAGSTAPEDAIVAGTTGAFSIEWGTVPSKIKVWSPNSKAQIISVNSAEQNGIETYELEGIFVDNDFNVVVDTTT